MRATVFYLCLAAFLFRIPASPRAIVTASDESLSLRPKSARNVKRNATSAQKRQVEKPQEPLLSYESISSSTTKQTVDKVDDMWVRCA